MKKQVLVTGATAGIGAAIADRFAKEGCRVIVTGRRKERLDAMTERIKHEYQVEAIALNFDIRERQEVEDAIDSLPQEWKNIDVLINNAGLAAGLDPIHEAKIEDWEQMIDTNVKGLLYISRKIMPLMTGRKKGHIINIGSIAGKQTYPKGHVYCASKHAVDSLSKAMRTDLLPYGIRVTQIRPGLVETEFSLVRFKGDEEKASKAYEGYQPLKPEDVADVAYYATTLPDHVTLNDIEITPTVQANSFIKNI
ncbi:MAG: SDR family NAD(P)-dependent oxidoreductase [Bacteroidales bacterium]|nr:SDR family NAD(P)-dependent oxidoreductase [Bacteroidales bacterium]MCF8336934.1 SDR family NAD(P)-dependent oxidoreductase [Bacteroidales bacterium]